MASSLVTELRKIYRGKSVLVTGHTGFKGGWLGLWLADLGASVTGYALAPDTRPALFQAAGVGRAFSRSVVADIRDLARFRSVLAETKPEFVFHLAAQPLVRRSYDEPLLTFETNVLGTAHILEALRLEGNPCAVVIVTSDKCYENRERVEGYREDEPMGGHDPYSSSKGAAELVTASYRNSFFPPARLPEHGIAVATARAGNVIGGGDWARDRIVPDTIAALANDQPVVVRNPGAIRPWQHVLEPLGGYLLLGARLSSAPPATAASFCEAWNFGPRPDGARSVQELVERIIQSWGKGAWEGRPVRGAPHEAGLLQLNIEKAQGRLGWNPRWDFDETARRTVAWYRAFHAGAGSTELADLCRTQIREYSET